MFDPVGYTAPVTLIHKVIFQKTLNLKLNRDDELSSSLVKSFKLWLRHLPASSQVQISRWLNITSENKNSATLHVFCNSCKQAYATCGYVRTENMSEIRVLLESARSRVSPLKRLTIPRLELLSCLIEARLASKIYADLKFQNNPVEWFIYCIYMYQKWRKMGNICPFVKEIHCPHGDLSLER